MASSTDPSSPIVTVEYRGRVAILTIDNQKKLNAFSQFQYHDFAQKLREVATHDEVFITVILAKGRYFSASPPLPFSSSLPLCFPLFPPPPPPPFSFSTPPSLLFLPPPPPKKKNHKFYTKVSLTPSGADVSLGRETPRDPQDAHRHLLSGFVALNLNSFDAFASHPKVLVVGLNGPVIGLSAALVASADFIYCVPQTFLLTPFSSLGLVAEGGASRTLVTRLGLAKANEALIMSRRIPAEELKASGFVNEIFDVGGGGTSTGNNDDRFRERVLREVDDRLGEHLIGESLTGIKKLIRDPERDILAKTNVNEVFAGLERFMKGVPQEEFRKIASGEKRHKL